MAGVSKADDRLSNSIHHSFPPMMLDVPHMVFISRLLQLIMRIRLMVFTQNFSLQTKVLMELIARISLVAFAKKFMLQIMVLTRVISCLFHYSFLLTALERKVRRSLSRDPCSQIQDL